MRSGITIYFLNEKYVFVNFNGDLEQMDYVYSKLNFIEEKVTDLCSHHEIIPVIVNDFNIL